MAILLYDLAADAEQIRFSPYCWRTKMALCHKGLAFDTIPWRFTDKDVIAPSGSVRVPVLVSGDRWIADSWTIALYLDEAFPAHPLMAGETARSLCQFINSWCDTSVNRALRPLALLRVMRIAHEKDKSYFRQSREKMLGMTLEKACADALSAFTALQEVLAPAEQVLSDRSFLAGDQPCYADYALFGSLKWVHALSGEAPLAAESAVERWFERMLDLFEGYARSAPTAVEDLR